MGRNVKTRRLLKAMCKYDSNALAPAASEYDETDVGLSAWRVYDCKIVRDRLP